MKANFQTIQRSMIAPMSRKLPLFLNSCQNLQFDPIRKKFKTSKAVVFTFQIKTHHTSTEEGGQYIYIIKTNLTYVVREIGGVMESISADVAALLRNFSNVCTGGTIASFSCLFFTALPALYSLN